jgi:hypothetical protein
MPAYHHNHIRPPTPANQQLHKEQMLERLSYLREAIPGLRGAHHQFAQSKEGRKVLVRPLKYQIGDMVLLRNSKLDKAIGHGSAFESKWIGPYKIHSVMDKGAYKLATMKAGVLKHPVNWSRLRRYVPEGDDEFTHSVEGEREMEE